MEQVCHRQQTHDTLAAHLALEQAKGDRDVLPGHSHSLRRRTPQGNLKFVELLQHTLPENSPNIWTTSGASQGPTSSGWIVFVFVFSRSSEVPKRVLEAAVENPRGTAEHLQVEPRLKLPVNLIVHRDS